MIKKKKINTRQKTKNCKVMEVILNFSTQVNFDFNTDVTCKLMALQFTNFIPMAINIGKVVLFI